MSVKHKPLLHETVAAGMRSKVAAFFSVTDRPGYRRITLNVTYTGPSQGLKIWGGARNTGWG